MSLQLSDEYRAINPHRLIEEIKLRPLLYDPRQKPSLGETRKHLWEVVAQALYNVNWSQLNEEEKENLVKYLQRKWKSLRDSFTRTLRREKLGEVDENSRKKYMYYEQLMFLAPFCGTKNSTVIFLDDIQNSNDSNMFLDEDIDDNDSNNSQRLKAIEFVNVQPNNNGEQTNDFKYTNNSRKNNVPSFDSRMTNIMEEVVKLQKADNSDDSMGNKMFLLSLLPYMQKLPDDINLEVRLQLMSVIHSYTSGKKA